MNEADANIPNKEYFVNFDYAAWRRKKIQDASNVWIYGFKIKRKIQYIGQAWNVYRRLKAHKNSQNSAYNKGLKIGKIKVVMIRSTDHLNANRIERQIIIALKKRGLCVLNVYLPKAVPKPNIIANRVLHIPTGTTLNSLAQAGRFIGESGRTVSNMIKRNDGIFRLI